MKRFVDIIVKVFTVIAIAAFSIMLISGAVQVFCRYLLQNSPMWTEELARYMFITASLSAAVVAMDRGAHMEVDIFTGHLKGKSKKICKVFSLCVVAIFCVATMCFGFELAAKTMSQPSPSLHIPMGLVYGTIPVGCIGILLVAVEQLILQFKNQPEPAEKGEV